MIALDGTFHCNGPEASSYFVWTEQSAFMWEFSMTRPWRQLLLAVVLKGNSQNGGSHER